MRTNYCGELGKDFAGKSVTVCGWVHRRRDHGGVIFCLLYTSPSPRDNRVSRMPSSA